MKQLVISVAIAILVVPVMAENIRGIDIEFVTIGNPGNAADTGGTPGCGAVDYKYRIGKYEVTNAQWNAFVSAAGTPGSGIGYAYSAFHSNDLQPTNNVSWYEAAQFCNYLTSGDKSKGAYIFSGDNANPGYCHSINRAAARTTYGTIYVIPTEDEWYKAAYFKHDGIGYSLYANGLDAIPAADNGWNYSGGVYGSPWDVGTGDLEQNGTKDMMGNVWEWTETLWFNSNGYFIQRGGSYTMDSDIFLASSSWNANKQYVEGPSFGFRIASIPEPCTLLLLGVGGVMLRKKS